MQQQHFVDSGRPELVLKMQRVDEAGTNEAQEDAKLHNVEENSIVLTTTHQEPQHSSEPASCRDEWIPRQERGTSGGNIFSKIS